MQVTDKNIVVTGGASGIGRALARRFAAEGAAKVVVADLNEEGATAVANEIGGLAIAANVGVEDDVINLVKTTESRVGAIDLFCSNAGIAVLGELENTNEEWQRVWDVNLMSHVYAARAVVPAMIERGGGYLLNTSSAAGLLSQIGSSTYSATKHAAIGFAEWLSITYGNRGIKVSVLCPQAVRTAMTAGLDNGGVAGVDGMMEAEELAETVIQTLAEERFLCLPHPQVLEYMQRKTGDYDRWIKGMRRLHELYG
ncbi:MAG: SDR family oxidoreductase [Alphaproteobacteria bacterium]|jgi:NAD(P)-dependent dehydrogenase (short-subunit alcohol dehydrogenase family)|nr:short-chain dehydrogenase [Rhodospirillaceae bacterium]MDP6022233.1 SDR family oxidoreductase [Alphaproteobacteria bacterium]MDP6253951.1 SDR family oxidoreductase [Alphaproteobacteria bacterium]MDP7056704.1 SDR family oxidoreductase [Alphaproteobacteria bacterium]MDP7227548.1 SDR family oxidoreductase [Alphaproteobacteria bacterium]|tara:strand:+ start:216 stop:980 length:765 start_codon:yes stop_codon:yes gene_type:complete